MGDGLIVFILEVWVTVIMFYFAAHFTWVSIVYTQENVYGGTYLIKKIIVIFVTALVTRAMFIAHGLIAIWRAYKEWETITMWLLLVPVGVLILEALFTIGARGGEEYKW